MNDKEVKFIPMNCDHLSLWKKWAEVPHVKEVWFINGYETTDYINQKIKGDGYNYPFIIYTDDLPLGYVQGCDLYAYRSKCKNPKGLFTDEKEGTWCIDLFIADSNYLGKGYGTKIVKQFVSKIFIEFGATKILIDPAENNKRAIRCYEKAGFSFDRLAHDGVTNCVVMKITKFSTHQESINLNPR